MMKFVDHQPTDTHHKMVCLLGLIELRPSAFAF